MEYPPSLIGNTSSFGVHFPASYVRLPECNHLTYTHRKCTNVRWKRDLKKRKKHLPIIKFQGIFISFQGRSFIVNIRVDLMNCPLDFQGYIIYYHCNCLIRGQKTKCVFFKGKAIFNLGVLYYIVSIKVNLPNFAIKKRAEKINLPFGVEGLVDSFFQPPTALFAPVDSLRPFPPGSWDQAGVPIHVSLVVTSQQGDPSLTDLHILGFWWNQKSGYINYLGCIKPCKWWDKLPT